MKKTLRRFGLFALVLPFLISCNIFSPFEADSSDQDHMESALACLSKNNDVGCADTEYGKMSPGDARYIPQCEVELSRAGLTLDTLINVIVNQTKGSTSTTSTLQIVGALAQALVPWDSTKGAAITSAATTCAQISSAGGDLRILLLALQYLTDCGLRMAHADNCQCDSDGNSTLCNAVTPTNDLGYSDGIVEKVDMGGDITGVLSSTKPGICKTEALACENDILNLTALNTTNLSNINTILNALKSLPIVSSGGSATIDRAALAQLLSQ